MSAFFVVHTRRATDLSLQRSELRSKVVQRGRSQLALVDKVSCEELDKLDLLVGCEAGNGSLEESSGRCLVHCDEALVVHESEEAHDELAVHTVSHAAVTRNGVAKVLDVEGALEARGEEAAERCNQRSEGCHDKDVELHRRDADSGRQVGPVRRDKWQLVVVRDEDRVRVALETSEDVGSEVVDRADEVFGAHEDIGHGEAEQDGKDPSTDEAWVC